MHNVTIRDSTAQSTGISDMVTVTQNITWDAPPNHRNIQRYVVNYKMEGQYTSNVTSNNATQATLVLLVPKKQTSTFTVWVVAVSKAGRGEYSDRVEFNYSSEPTWHIYHDHVQYCTLQLPSLLYCLYRTRPAHWTNGSQNSLQQYQYNMVCPQLHWRSTSEEVHS